MISKTMQTKIVKVDNKEVLVYIDHCPVCNQYQEIRFDTNACLEGYDCGH